MQRVCNIIPAGTWGWGASTLCALLGYIAPAKGWLLVYFISAMVDVMTAVRRNRRIARIRGDRAIWLTSDGLRRATTGVGVNIIIGLTIMAAGDVYLDTLALGSIAFGLMTASNIISMLENETTQTTNPALTLLKRWLHDKTERYVNSDGGRG